jgi:hypothetical protein
VTDTLMHFGWLPKEPDWALRLENARKLEPGKQDGQTRWVLSLDRFQAAPVSITIFEGSP